MVKLKPFKLEWDAHEYEHKDRSPDWFWAVGIVTVSIAIASIIFGDIIFGILIILSAVSLALFINRPPETVHVVISERGIARGATLYPLETLHAFWVDEEHSHPHILLRSRKVFMPLIVVPIGAADPDRIRAVLAPHLPEEPMSLPLVEKFLEYLGF